MNYFTHTSPHMHALRACVLLCVVWFVALFTSQIAFAHNKYEASCKLSVNSAALLHNDAVGKPIAATDATGKVIWLETYTAYGERVISDPAASNNRQWFHGKPQDAESGLQYFGARYPRSALDASDDPALGRFMGVGQGLLLE